MAKKIEDITKKENTKNTNNKSTEELFIFAKNIEVNEEKYTIKQILPKYNDLWFELNKKNEIIKFENKKTPDGYMVIDELFSKVPVLIKSICKKIETDE